MNWIFHALTEIWRGWMRLSLATDMWIHGDAECDIAPVKEAMQPTTGKEE